MNKGKIYYIINNLLDKYDNGENIEENMFIDALVKIKDIVEENTNKSLLDENYNLQSKIDKATEFIKESNTYYEITHYIPEDEKQFKINMETLTNHLLDILKEDK